jgi:PAS domain S-box-containing protein
MSFLPEKFVIPPHIAYLLLGKGLRIVDFSEQVQLFALNPADILINGHVCQAFPELIGAEELLEEMRQGNTGQYELREVARGEVYFNLHATPIANYLILLFEDVTEMMNLKQSLVQRANEAELLLSALRHSKDYLDKVVLSMGDALIITNPHGQIQSINQAAIAMFGYVQGELLGQSLQKLVPTQVWQKHLAPGAIARHQSTIKNIEVECLTKAQDSLTIEFSCSRVLADLNQNESFVYIGRNITARKQAELEQQKAIAKERALVELKANFLSIASHEFRNPIGSILMCTEILQHSKAQLSPEEQDMYIDFIKQAGNNLKAVMEDVLLISKVDAGKLQCQPTELNLNLFCERLVQQIQLSTGVERIKAQYSDQITTVQMDGKLLQHILQNLLSNGLKYSPEDQPIDFIVELSPTQPGQVQFTIRDRGIGIPAEDLEHIFESFHRAKNVGEIPGTGLGMAITYKYIHLHQGDITIESTENQGTTVTVTLPLSFTPQNEYGMPVQSGFDNNLIIS